MTTTGSHTLITTSMLCSTIRNVTPSSRSRRTRSTMTSSRAGLMPPAGSSSSMSRRLARQLGDADEGEQVHGALALGGRHARLQEMEQAAGLRLHDDVLQHAQPGKIAADLERARDALPGDPMR